MRAGVERSWGDGGQQKLERKGGGRERRTPWAEEKHTEMGRDVRLTHTPSKKSTLLKGERRPFAARSHVTLRRCSSGLLVLLLLKILQQWRAGLWSVRWLLGDGRSALATLFPCLHPPFEMFAHAPNFSLPSSTCFYTFHPSIFSSPSPSTPAFFDLLFAPTLFRSTPPATDAPAFPHCPQLLQLRSTHPPNTHAHTLNFKLVRIIFSPGFPLNRQTRKLPTSVAVRTLRPVHRSPFQWGKVDFEFLWVIVFRIINVTIVVIACGRDEARCQQSANRVIQF